MNQGPRRRSTIHSAIRPRPKTSYVSSDRDSAAHHFGTLDRAASHDWAPWDFSGVKQSLPAPDGSSAAQPRQTTHHRALSSMVQGFMKAGESIREAVMPGPRPQKMRKTSRDIERPQTAHHVSSAAVAPPEPMPSFNALLPTHPHIEKHDSSMQTPRLRTQSVRQTLTRPFAGRMRRKAIACEAGHNASSPDYAISGPADYVRAFTGSMHAPPPEPGAAARASAAHQNSLNQSGIVPRFMRKEPKPSSPTDYDSGVGMEGIITEHPVPMITVDPATRVPTELFVSILSHLEYTSLANAEWVSKNWRQVASSQHTWREVYQRRYEQKTPSPPTPLAMGGEGMGGPRNPEKDWKKMYQVRRQIEKNWNEVNPKAIYFNGHTDSVYCCQFDEEKIITGSRDRTIRVWNINTHECEKVIGGPASKPQFSNAPPLMIRQEHTVSNIPSINGTPEGDALYHIPSDYHSASILCLQYDNEIMVTGSSDATCIVWDMKTYEPIRRLRKHVAGVLDVCFDSKYIVSCSKDATICIWDRATGNLVKTLESHQGPVNAVQLRGHLLVSASGDQHAKLWNLDTFTLVKEFKSKDRGLAAVEFSPDCKHLLAGGNDQVIYKYDASTGQLVHSYTGHGGLVRSLYLDAHNNRVLSGSYDQSMRVYDFQTGRDIQTFPDWTTSWILSAKSDYRRIVATSQDGRAVMMDFGWDVERKDLLNGDSGANEREAIKEREARRKGKEAVSDFRVVG